MIKMPDRATCPILLLPERTSVMHEIGPARENDPRMRTADGAPITNGARLFNYYDWEWVIVEYDEGGMSHAPTAEYFDGWFHCRVLDADGIPTRRMTLLNGERLASQPPRR